MSLANTIGLLRNGMCVAKTLLPNSHIVKQVWLNGPLRKNKVMFIEYAIGLTQSAGVYFNTVGGYCDIVNGLQNCGHMQKLIQHIDMLALSGGTEGSAEYCILRHAAIADRCSALRKAFTGFCKFNIGAGFVFLVLNTLHLNGPTHPQPLFQALGVILSSLFAILAVMFKGILGAFWSSGKMNDVADSLEFADGKQTTLGRILIASKSGFNRNLMEALQLVEPSFAPGYREKRASNLTAKQDLIAISDLLSRDPADDRVTNVQLASQLRTKATNTAWAAALDSVFLLLNFIAFYGYAVGAFGWFFVPTKALDTLFGQFVHYATFQMTQDQCFYWGFLAGDVAWTIEPAVALLSGKIMAFLTQQKVLNFEYAAVIVVTLMFVFCFYFWQKASDSAVDDDKKEL